MLSGSFVFVVVVAFIVVATPKVVNLAETGCLSIGLSFSWHRCYIYLAIFVYMYSPAVALMTFNQKWQHKKFNLHAKDLQSESNFEFCFEFCMIILVLSEFKLIKCDCSLSQSLHLSLWKEFPGCGFSYLYCRYLSLHGKIELNTICGCPTMMIPSLIIYDSCFSINTQSEVQMKPAR